MSISRQSNYGVGIIINELYIISLSLSIAISESLAILAMNHNESINYELKRARQHSVGQ